MGVKSWLMEDGLPAEEILRGDVQVEWIAEVSSNHNQDESRCFELIRAAANSGFTSVKFQLFKVATLFSPEALRAKPELLDREAWELSPNLVPQLSAECRAMGLKFSVTPFSTEMVKASVDYVDFFKIASYEILWDELLEAVAASEKPVTISSGMASLPEVEHAVSVLKRSGCEEVSVLHCVSSYPAPTEDANLAAIQTIRDATGLRVGWSDHTHNPGVIHRAVHRWGAEIIEMHVDLDGQGFEFEPGHCWLLEEADSVIRHVNHGFLADGDGAKEPRNSELSDRDWRADPVDGLRPLKHKRVSLEGGSPL